MDLLRLRSWPPALKSKGRRTGYSILSWLVFIKTCETRVWIDHFLVEIPHMTDQLFLIK